MAKITVIKGGDDSYAGRVGRGMDRVFEDAMEYLAGVYHTYAKDGRPEESDEARLERTYYEKMADDIAANADTSGKTPIGKLVV